ncbi:hypothetical protein ASF58_18720 [Methylobacterium sp. Leaf125]|uniref:beta strand repeat-containing protein n=1 Tax=Methylobacterium sp. Leaf125 TaxID=1736265 RepID=UPI0006FCF973|nr:hypothetical protein [Methylobacterium sp. Leaf125]KQQ45616.1 hypothetical protein ASF58_18720 [Methylobacterium sp. Leaf125]
MYTMDGNLGEWAPSDRLNPVGSGPTDYGLYGHIEGGVASFAITAPAGTAIGTYTTLWLDTDASAATGYTLFGLYGGYDFNINIAPDGKPYLYTGADGGNLVSGTPLAYAYNADRTVLEFSLPTAQIGGPISLNVLADVNNAVFIPGDYAAGPYTIAETNQPGDLTLSGLTNGDATEGTPIVATLSDADGLMPGGTVLYTFLDIVTNQVLQATASNSYTPTYGDSGKIIAVTATYTDALGHADTASASAGTVIDVDRAGSLLLSGSVAEGETVSASLSDPDGVPAAGSVSYAFQLDGSTVETNTSGQYTLGYADAGKALSVVASYTDGQSHAGVASATGGTVVDVDRAGIVLLSGLVAEGQTVSASLSDPDGTPAPGSVTYAIQLDGSTVETNTSGQYTLGYADAGKLLSVVASYTDGQGHAGIASAAGGAVTDVDRAGSLLLLGPMVEGQTVSASLSDPDGVPAAGGVSYAFQLDGSTVETNTSGQYTLGYADSGKLLSVVASYTDAQGHADIASAAGSTVTDVDRAGSLILVGSMAEGQTVSAVLSDPDGVPAPGAVRYAFQLDGSTVETNTSGQYTLGYGEAGKVLAVVASYTDAQGHDGVVAAAGGTVTDANRAGSVLLSGLVAEGETVSASLSDPDGTPAPGSVTYAFQLDGSTVETNTSGQYTLGYADAGKVLAVVASYTDAQGHADIASAAGGAVTDVDRAGSLLFSGPMVEGQTVSASLSDPDGTPAPGSVSYAFQLDGSTVETNTSGQYTLGYADAGKVLAVVASYTDAQGHADIASTAGGTVTDVDRAGSLLLSGPMVEGQTVSASLSDPDGTPAPGSVSYAFQLDGSTVETNTSGQYTLGYADAGKVLAVVASYTDAQGHADIASAAGGSVTDVDRAGSLLLSGLMAEGQTVSAVLSDPDGVPAAGGVRYAFQLDGSTVETNTSGQYTLGYADAGKLLSVVASYSDAQGHADIASAVGGSVTDVDRAGSLLLSGPMAEGQTVSASLSDPDGGPVPGGASYAFQLDGSTVETNASGQYTLGYADGGKVLSVIASYSDAQGHDGVVAAAGGSVTDVDRAGSLLLSGLVVEGQTVSASLSDPDGGPAPGGVRYAFQLDGSTVETNTSGQYTLGYADAGKVLSVIASYTDAQGHDGVVAAAGGSVADGDRAGSLVLAGLSEGKAVEGQMLTARVTDADGDPAAGSVAYDFTLDGIVVETNTTGVYTPGYQDGGKSLTIAASYTDGLGHDGRATETIGAIIDVGSRDSVTFNFAFDASQVRMDEGRAFLIDPNGLSHDVTGIYEIRFTDGTIVENDASPLVDDLFYYGSNKDVWRDGMDADTHYAQFGWQEGRDPNAAFSTTGYLAANADVAAAKVNPLTHYETQGWKEGRDPSSSFDNELYLARNPDVKADGMNPLTHYLAFGQAEGRETYDAVGRATDLNTHPGFDAEYYLLSNRDVAQAALKAGGDSFAFAYQHYETNGWHEGRNPNAIFDTQAYLNAYADVAAANMDPLAHYHAFGWKEGRDPSASFHTNAYEAANPDVGAAQMDPMLHYLQFGAIEGRSPLD